MKRLLLAPLILALSSPVLATERKVMRSDIYNLGVHAGGLSAICLSHSKGFISKENATEMISLMVEAAKPQLEPINQWEPFKNGMKESFSKSVCKDFVYLLKD